ncbi:MULTISPECIES: FGGY family carbohydrate kinase [Bacteria]|uniref:FGGY family carbohydrate kinase n=1 Tax=Bacteria TaxID=2 RepID=UPI003C7CB4FF
MTLVAGVDSSTQSCKVVVREVATGQCVRTGRAPHPDGTEVAPVRWWEALEAALAAAGGIADVESISIAGQQHGLVALDEGGRVIRDALLWNDVRSAAAAVDLTAEVGADVYARRVGVVPVASFTASKLRWLRDAEPENAARVAAVALPHDWLTWRLRGYGPRGESELGPDLDALTTDRSDASGTAYWSAATNAYDLELFGIAFGRAGREAGAPGTGVILPRVIGPDQGVGQTEGGTLIAPGAGDNAAAALGAGAARGDVVVSIGTSGTAFAVSDSPAADPTGVVAGFADATGGALPLVATLNAARVLDAAARLLGVAHAELATLALESEPGAEGVVLVPYFEGERTPNLPSAKAQVRGLTLATSRPSNLARAAVEGMLCGIADGVDALAAQGVGVRRVLLIGGAAQNAAVQRVAAQVFDVPVEVPSPGEYVADGAAVQASWVLTSEQPHWRTASRVLDRDTRAVIRAQYRESAARVAEEERRR